MRGKLAVLVVFLLVGISAANPPRPYVGGSLQYQGINEVEPPHRHGCTEPAWPSYSGFGGQLEGGLRTDLWNAYLAFRHDRGSHNFSDVIWERWRSERFVLGGRLRASYHDRNRVIPVIGAAGSIGWAQRRHEDRRGSETEHYSKAGIGWLLEAGIEARLYRRISTIFLLRFEDQGLHLKRSYYQNETRTVTQLSLSLGLLYDFR
jgi:hypothetical protein